MTPSQQISPPSRSRAPAGDDVAIITDLPVAPCRKGGVDGASRLYSVSLRSRVRIG